jgi:hypothetical protein
LKAIYDLPFRQLIAKFHSSQGNTWGIEMKFNLLVKLYDGSIPTLSSLLVDNDGNLRVYTDYELAKRIATTEQMALRISHAPQTLHAEIIVVEAKP